MLKLKLLPLSKGALTALSYLLLGLFMAWLFVVVNVSDAAFSDANWLAALVGALTVLRVAHAVRFPRDARQSSGEQLDRARVESGRLWLPISEEQRDLLTVYQNLLLDDVASLLARMMSLLASPDTSNWWFSEEELTIRLPIEGQDDIGLKASNRTFHIAVIHVGRMFSTEYDDGFLYDEEVVFPIDHPEEAIDQALHWLEDEILESTATDGGSGLEAEADEGH